MTQSNENLKFNKIIKDFEYVTPEGAKACATDTDVFNENTRFCKEDEKRDRAAKLIVTLM